MNNKLTRKQEDVLVICCPYCKEEILDRDVTKLLDSCIKNVLCLECNKIFNLQNNVWTWRRYNGS